MRRILDATQDDPPESSGEDEDQDDAGPYPSPAIRRGRELQDGLIWIGRTPPRSVGRSRPLITGGTS